VLACVLERDGEQLLASQVWRQGLSDADHLAFLNAIWTAEATPARHQRYQDLYLAALPPGYRQEPGHQAKWLWRTLRAAELAGQDAAEALAAAIAERDLTGARDILSVIDARLRRKTGSLVPLPAGPWWGQPTGIADPERRAYTARIVTLMDECKTRIGGHAATSALPWAVTVLGPVPAAGPGRLDWRRRARPAGLAAAGQLHRRLPRAVRLRPPHRPHRPGPRHGNRGPARRLARGPSRPRNDRSPGRAGHARRDPGPPARHLPHRDRLGARVDRR
jgi:hypothetical protein